MILVLVGMLCGLPAGAYQAGQQNRTNFNNTQRQQGGYRSFSNYNNRTWGQGVQTQGVQTQTVQTELATQKQSPAVGKKQVAATPDKPAAQPVAPTQASSGAASQTVVPAQAAGQPPAEAAAMMQQVQGMMNMVNSMTGQTGMPAGMPDMSALMGGNTQTPSAPKVPQGAKR